MEKQRAWYEVSAKGKISTYRHDMLEARWDSDGRQTWSAQFQAESDEEAVTKAHEVVEKWKEKYKRQEENNNSFRLDYMRFESLFEVERFLVTEQRVTTPMDLEGPSHQEKLLREIRYVKKREVSITESENMSS